MRRVADHYGGYKPLFETVGDGSRGKTLEDVFYEREVQMNVLAFNIFENSSKDSHTDTHWCTHTSKPTHSLHPGAEMTHIKVASGAPH
ncbi:hypothetical protein GH733_000197 [Mirounga leonina]|nr:hypothetical protein GH733_000197 [Mirounga leonina]